MNNAFIKHIGFAVIFVSLIQCSYASEKFRISLRPGIGIIATKTSMESPTQIIPVIDNAYDIAIANKISNPNLIFSGTKLVLPNVTPKALTKGEIDQRSTTQVTQTNSKYIVKAGDYLWKIALESYGDGFAWVKIAKINNLNNPNIIEPGQVLIIPR